MKFSAVFAFVSIILLLAANIDAKIVKSGPLASFSDFTANNHQIFGAIAKIGAKLGGKALSGIAKGGAKAAAKGAKSIGSKGLKAVTKGGKSALKGAKSLGKKGVKGAKSAGKKGKSALKKAGKSVAEDAAEALAEEENENQN